MRRRTHRTHLGLAVTILAVVLLPGVLAAVTSGCSRPAPAQTQPIDFRHTVHAGDNQIPCQYCHAYASKSQVAGIPPVSVCFGCHKVVSGSTPEYQSEIKKVLDYWNRKEEIPWVRIHDVPDFVYFSHKRHIQAGFDCKECHGDVKSMQSVHAVATLKMGFCVKCHRANSYEKGQTAHPASIDCLTCHK